MPIRFPFFLICCLMALVAGAFGLDAPGELKAGATDAQGNLILHVLQSDDHRALPMILQDDYGFVVFNDGSEAKPKMRVVIALKSSKRLVECRTWPEVNKALELIPEGSEIHGYCKCLCPLYFGLKDDFWNAFQAALDKRKLKHSEEQDRITCTCAE